MANKPLKSIKFPGLPDTYTIEGLSSSAKAALLNCFAHVAWIDEHGQDYYDALENALYGSEPHEWDDGYMWLYQPTAGLLSEQSYATKGLVGQGGTETISEQLFVIHANSPASESAGQNAIRYDLTPVSQNYNRILCKAQIVDTYLAPSTSDAKINGGFQVVVSNGTNGILAYIGKDSSGNIHVEHFNGNTKTIAATQIPIEGEHIFDATLYGSRQTLKIDGEVVFDNTTPSTFYTTTNRIGVAGTIPERAPSGATANIKWIAFYNEEVN